MFGIEQNGEFVQKGVVILNYQENDRRTLRTKAMIREALFGLMSEKQYSKITIQDIIDRANIGRSTFYSHYETKDELMQRCIEDLLQNYIGNCEERKQSEQRILPIAEFFEHIRENSKVMKGLISSESGEIFLGQVQQYWNVRIIEYIKERSSPDKIAPVPIDVVSNYVSGTLIWLLKWWFTNKIKYTPKQMDDYFHELVRPSLALYIDKEEWK
jgi:AcrR family transcriptional regulator